MSKICPACQKENPAEATICNFCGAPLVELLLASRTTEPVPEQPLKLSQPEHVVHLTKLHANIIVFTVLGQEQPILAKGDSKIIVGRYSPGDIAPTVDLTPYNANLLGVSRQHAVISRSDKTYMLQDMDSTNGTWINEVKLIPHKPYPLRSGDLVRFGQLAVYVYFDTSQGEQEITVELVLKKSLVKTGKNQLTVQEFSQHLTPYLTAIEKIQRICDELLTRDPVTVSIVALEFDADLAHIKLKLDGAQEAVRLLKSSVSAWNASEPVSVVETEQSSAPGSAPVAQPIHTNGEAKQEDSGKNEKLFKSVLASVNEIVASRLEVKQADVEKLIPLINELAASPLVIDR